MSKDLVTGILITCLAVTVCALVPIVGLMGSAFVPVPLVFYRAALGSQAAKIIALAALGYVFVLGGTLEAFFFGELLLIGYVLGALMARRWPLDRTVAGVCGAVFGSGLAALALYGIASGRGIEATLVEGVRYNLELTFRLYRQMGIPPDQMQFLEDAAELIEKVMVGMMPALVIGSTLVVSWISLLSARLLLQRKGLAFPDYGLLDHWKAPEVLVWGLIASGILLLVPSLAVKTVGLNGLVIFMVVYFFQGIAIVAYFFRKKQVPRLARVALYSLIAVQQLVMLAVAALGLFDTWFNFRKIGKPPASG